MKPARAIIGFLLSLVFLIFFAYTISGLQLVYLNYIKTPTEEVFLGSVSDSITEENTVEKSTPTLDINAEAAISVETNLNGDNKVLFEKDADKKLPIASLTKLMTGIVVLDNYNLSKILIVDEAADSQDPMKQDVKLGDTMAVENLLEIMLIGSSNKSAYALSEMIGTKKFVELMNRKAEYIGLKNTSFVDPTGLSDQNISTAKDLVRLTEHILKNYPKIAMLTRAREFYVPGFGKILNTDELLQEIPDVVCSKTGFTTEAKGCLLLAVNSSKASGYLINVILGADDRFSEMKKLINWSNSICN